MKRKLLAVVVALCLFCTGCSENRSVMLNEEYQEAINDNHIIELITNYYITWGEALKEAKESNDIFVFCNYYERLDDLYSEIVSNLSTAEYVSNRVLLALNYDILSFHQLPLVVNVGKAYENLIGAYGGNMGYEGLQKIAIDLGLLSEYETGFESINSMNKIIIEAFSEKYHQIAELYFDDK